MMSMHPLMSAPTQPGTNGRRADVIYGTVVGLLCVGLKAFWAIGLVLATRGTGTGPGSLDMGRMAVWGFLVAPGAGYLSLMSSYGAAALWDGAPGFRWFSGPEASRLFRPLPSEEITLARSAGCGALGGLLGLASLSIVIAALFVLCLVMAFLGPGPVILLGWLGLMLAAVAASLLWGGLIGSLIFCRRRFGWPVGIAVSGAVVVICNVVVGTII